MAGQHWLEPEQQHAAVTALAVVRSWSDQRDDPDAALLDALRQQDPATAMIGLATVARLLAIELGACSHRSEHAVLADLAERVSSPAPAADAPAADAPARRR